MYLPNLRPEQLSAGQASLYGDMKPVLASDFSSIPTHGDDGTLIGPWGAWIHNPHLGSAAWQLAKVVTTGAKLPANVRQTAILVVGSHFQAEYELYAHKMLASTALSSTKVAALSAGTRPSDLSSTEGMAYDVTCALLHGGPLPQALYAHAAELIGIEGASELIYLVGAYCVVSTTLNGFAVQAPTGSCITARASEYQTINPTNGQVLRTFPETTDDEVAKAVEFAHSQWEQDWRLRKVGERTKLIAKAASLMRERAEHLAQLVTQEMGKLIEQSRYEVSLSADILDYYATHTEEFVRPRILPDVEDSVVKTEPIGIVVTIEPWNFPYYQLARVVGPQLAVGNAVIVKHAPTVPQCALAFAQLFHDAQVPDGIYTNLFCTISQVNMLIDDFRVRGVTLTGSERAGSSVAQRAGKNLKKVVLELGGSDPFIVLEDANLDQAITAGCAGRLACMGQACVSSKRFIVVGKERGRQFLDGMKHQMGNLKIGDPADPSTTLGPLFSERAVTDLLTQIETARDHGATIVLGGRRIDCQGYYLEPTIISNISEDNPLFLQETFGPVASFYVVETEAEAIRIANATPFGLGAVIFGQDLKHAQKMADRIDAGMVFINSAAYTAPEVPFGGIKNSGFGRELSELGVGEFVNKKLVKSTEL